MITKMTTAKQMTKEKLTKKRKRHRGGQWTMKRVREKKKFENLMPMRHNTNMRKSEEKYEIEDNRDNNLIIN